MLISTLYHNINADKYSNECNLFEKHLHHIKENFNVVVPGDQLTGKDICLTFDDGFYNFYVYVYPLLKRLNLKAVLAVPTQFILEHTDIPGEERLGFLHDDTYARSDKAPFCTYEELREMSDSGHVTIASHSHSHVNLQECDNLIEELELSKELLETKLEITCESFVFPFGKYNDEVVHEASKRYRYLFRIGNGLNKDFNGIKGVIYRINADSLQDEKEIFSLMNRAKYAFKSFIKSF